MVRKHMWGEVYEPLVDDQRPHNPHFVENSMNEHFQYYRTLTPTDFLSKKWSPPEIQECEV
jgi:hypothetical protein